MDSATTNQNEPNEDVVIELECEIEEDVKAELEDFVRLSHIGHFKDAHELYDECLSRYDDWFPVAAEYADCLLREGDLEQLGAFCEGASRKFQDHEYALLKLMSGIGFLEPRDVMWRMLQILWPDLELKPPFTSLRDTDIHLLEIVLQILVFSELNPEDLDASLSSARLWGVFNDWFYFLLRHDYFWEAQRISHSLFYTLSQLECQDLVRDYIAKALSANIDQESVKIAVSSIVQNFISAFEGINTSVITVVQWNDAITWALFGATLGRAEDSTSLFSRLCLRRSLELELNRSLPLDDVNGNDELNDLIHEVAMYGDVAGLEIFGTQPGPCTLEELNRRAFFRGAHFYSHNLLPFSPGIVNAQDGYQRTPLHWASLMAQGGAVETLLNVGKADAGLLDWFGRTPLHYAINSCNPGSETESLRVVKALLNSDSTSVNTRDLTGQTPLNMAIVRQAYNVAELLLEHNTIIETRDYGALLLLDGDTTLIWKRLLSKYDHSKPSVLGKCKEFETPALRFQKASLYHPGTIDLNSYAALFLRALHPDCTDEFLPSLRSFLECECSLYELPTASQVRGYISERQRFQKPIVAAEAYQTLLEPALRVTD